MQLTQFAVDDNPHNGDGLVLHGLDGSQQVIAFISKRVMDDWVDPRKPYGRRKGIFRAQHNALGNRNLAAIEQIVTSKYERGAPFYRQHPFAYVVLAYITESGEVPGASELARERACDHAECP
jgi:hypothetical protein